MSTKLTLLVEESVIEEAKLYAKKQGRSISNIVEEYLKTVTATSKKSTTELFHIQLTQSTPQINSSYSNNESSNV